MHRFVFAVLVLLSTASVARAQLSAGAKPTVDFTSKVKPIFSKHCYECHSEVRKKEKGGFVFDKPERLAKNIGRGLIIVPGNIEDSDLIGVVSGQSGKKLMPPEGKGHLSDKEIEILKTWIQEGANVPGIDIAKRMAETTRTLPKQFMNWTNTEGRKLRAKFVRLEDDSVVLEAETGTVYKVALSTLDLAGRAQAQMQAKK